MKFATAIIVGAGQSGLAMSWHLSTRSIDHVVLERGEVANSWLKERWDSLRLLTPNWQSRLPGYAYSGDDPDGFMTMPEVVRFLHQYASLSRAPIVTGARVTRVRQQEAGYEVETNLGAWRCRKLVIATGACNLASIPQLAAGLPARVASLTPLQYRNPGLLPDGGVMIVGASASGIQLAREIRAAGRRVVLCVGEHVRLPRTYRGRDIQWWMDVIGAMDVRYDTMEEDIERARRLPSLQLIGTPERVTVDLNSLGKAGVELVGRVVGLADGKAQFSGSLANLCALADLKMNRLLSSIDDWVNASGLAQQFPAPHRFEPTDVGSQTRIGLDLNDAGIGSVIWATGYRPDYSWLDVPVLDRKGRIRHDGGIVPAPGIYVMGLPFMRRRKSSFIDGADDDAADLAAHLGHNLNRAAA
ncbi:NAD(P)-binding domain-containing protein [Bradyrhizobium manausense]|uniref:NAD(P)-binding domain-containing protein n=1 Tax=Bradyrhizobium TaxID=374 RepID=UPI001BA5994B|nr:MULTISPECIES: NAD(P)-binding domain-containing protein [Bradyrhizobium]MBR0831464.1 NAD(P)-binding domain-containing protein [Bradyrhizobium manausense]UVO27078.1 NAD(P)-binding domain-containing protein [Bradyrhizobium arachidis]